VAVVDLTANQDEDPSREGEDCQDGGQTGH